MSLAAHPFWLDGGYDEASVEGCPHHAVRFSLDDGEIMEFDRIELLSALGTVIAGDMGRLRAA